MLRAKPSRPMRLLKGLVQIFGVNGIDLKRLAYAIVSLPLFVRDIFRYRRMAKPEGRFPLRLSQIYPCLPDYRDASGTASGHYFHQDLLVARKIIARAPGRHIDIGSRVDGFVAHLLCVMPVECVDIRPLESKIAGLRFLRCDATELTEFDDGSVDSISTLHAAEHFGLGRYSDPVDPNACFRFMRALMRVLDGITAFRWVRAAGSRAATGSAACSP